ncbi:MAG: PQQ-binding-like beta-propeller repeat protein [Kiritimatiellae bacterium]|nr:PQQ-binding-like beta-propeller repeat protein [Kiritimatiellia bacterium]
MVSIYNKKQSLANNLTFPVLVIILMIVGWMNAYADWPEFRGPWGNGHVSAPGDTKTIGFPIRWSETENIKWKIEIPERGWSTPVVMGGQVWLTTATTNGHDYFVICVDAETGKILFNEKLFHCDNPEPLGNKVNCYATPSCTIEPGRVYVHFGSYGTACLDTSTAKVIWKRQDLPCRHYRGPASSLILFENLLILTMDGVDLQYLVALDKKTGETVWKTNRSVAWNDENFTDQMTRDGDRRKAHCTPLIVDVKGKLQMLTIGAKAAYGYDPRTGKELWRVQYNSWSAAPMPLYDPKSGLAFIITGLSNTELLAVRLDGQGDVTDTHVAWKCNKAVAKTASPILVDGLIYMASDDGMGSCIKAANGNLVWQERMGGKYAASPILADSRLYFFNQSGKTTILKPGRTYEVLATNNLDNGFMASPAASGKSLILRTKTHLYRIEESVNSVGK